MQVNFDAAKMDTRLLAGAPTADNRWTVFVVPGQPGGESKFIRNVSGIGSYDFWEAPKEYVV